MDRPVQGPISSKNAKRIVQNRERKKRLPVQTKVLKGKMGMEMSRNGGKPSFQKNIAVIQGMMAKKARRGILKTHK